jgi:predicted dehydrogenase
MMREVVWGIIGCGDVTEVKSGPAFERVRGSRLAAVMRRDAAKAADYARRHDVPRWYDRVDALLADPEINAVYVATPTNTHLPLTLAALASGRPVLVEKPMALDGGEAEGMIAAAERAGLPLFVAYYKRALPRFERLRELVHAGRLGEVRGITVHHVRPGHFAPRQDWKLDPAVNGGGLFVDAHVHTLDWFDHCFGPPSEVQGMVRRLGDGPGEDLVAYTLGWPDGRVASGLYCFGVGPEDEQVTLWGSRGCAETSFFLGREIVVRDLDGGVERIECPDPAQPHEPMIARIVDELRGGPPAPNRARDAARTTKLVDRLYADFRAGDRAARRA